MSGGLKSGVVAVIPDASPDSDSSDSTESLSFKTAVTSRSIQKNRDEYSTSNDSEFSSSTRSDFKTIVETTTNSTTSTNRSHIYTYSESEESGGSSGDNTDDSVSDPRFRNTNLKYRPISHIVQKPESPLTSSVRLPGRSGENARQVSSSYRSRSQPKARTIAHVRSSSLSSFDTVSYAKPKETSSRMIHGAKPTHTPSGPTETMREILEYLFIGTLFDAKSKHKLRNHGIGFVVNLSPSEVPNFHPTEFVYFQVEIELPDEKERVFDEEKLSSPPPFPFTSSLPALFAQLELVIRAKDRVLIHDTHGTSRPAAVVIPFLIHKYDFSLAQAYRLVSERFPPLHIGSATWMVLGDWELRERGKSSLSEIVFTLPRSLPPLSSPLYTFYSGKQVEKLVKQNKRVAKKEVLRYKSAALQHIVAMEETRKERQKAQVEMVETVKDVESAVTTSRNYLTGALRGGLWVESERFTDPGRLLQEWEERRLHHALGDIHDDEDEEDSHEENETESPSNRRISSLSRKQVSFHALRRFVLGYGEDFDPAVVLGKDEKAEDTLAFASISRTVDAIPLGSLVQLLSSIPWGEIGGGDITSLIPWNIAEHLPLEHPGINPASVVEKMTSSSASPSLSTLTDSSLADLQWVHSSPSQPPFSPSLSLAFLSPSLFSLHSSLFSLSSCVSQAGQLITGLRAVTVRLHSRCEFLVGLSGSLLRQRHGFGVAFVGLLRRVLTASEEQQERDHRQFEEYASRARDIAVEAATASENSARREKELRERVQALELAVGRAGVREGGLGDAVTQAHDTVRRVLCHANAREQELVRAFDSALVGATLGHVLTRNDGSTDKHGEGKETKDPLEGIYDPVTGKYTFRREGMPPKQLTYPEVLRIAAAEERAGEKPNTTSNGSDMEDAQDMEDMEDTNDADVNSPHGANDNVKTVEFFQNQVQGRTAWISLHKAEAQNRETSRRLTASLAIATAARARSAKELSALRQDLRHVLLAVHQREAGEAVGQELVSSVADEREEKSERKNEDEDRDKEKDNNKGPNNHPGKDNFEVLAVKSVLERLFGVDAVSSTATTSNTGPRPRTPTPASPSRSYESQISALTSKLTHERALQAELRTELQAEKMEGVRRLETKARLRVEAEIREREERKQLETAFQREKQDLFAALKEAREESESLKKCVEHWQEDAKVLRSNLTESAGQLHQALADALANSRGLQEDLILRTKEVEVLSTCCNVVLRCVSLVWFGLIYHSSCCLFSLSLSTHFYFIFPSHSPLVFS